MAVRKQHNKDVKRLSSENLTPQAKIADDASGTLLSTLLGVHHRFGILVCCLTRLQGLTLLAQLQRSPFTTAAILSLSPPCIAHLPYIAALLGNTKQLHWLSLQVWLLCSTPQYSWNASCLQLAALCHRKFRGNCFPAEGSAGASRETASSQPCRLAAASRDDQCQSAQRKHDSPHIMQEGERSQAGC